MRSHSARRGRGIRAAAAPASSRSDDEAGRPGGDDQCTTPRQRDGARRRRQPRSVQGETRQADTALAVEADERQPPPRKVVPHLSPEERVARGRATRAELPRSDHAVWEPPPLRHDPVAILEEQATTRVPELVPIRYRRMLVSPFTFFRGGAYLMASDLSGQPRTGLTVQLCGDAHLSNFGMFAAPDRRMLFSLNDFDETLPGPFEWDVKRLAASFAVAGRDIGLTAKQRDAVNEGVARGYREAMASFAEMSDLAIWYARLDVESMLDQIREV